MVKEPVSSMSDAGQWKKSQNIEALTFNSLDHISTSPNYLPNDSHYVSLENLVWDQLVIS